MSLLDAFTGDSAKRAAEENSARLAALKGEGLGYLDAGKTGALGSIDSAKGYFSPVAALGSKYNAAGDMYLNALGINGAGGNAAATSAYQTSPGYDFKVNSSLDALDRRASSRGMLASGNNTVDTLNTVHGIADQDYSSWLNNLSNLTNLGATTTTAGASGLAGLEASKAPIYTNDANSRVGLASTVATGQNSQTTQAANAEMQGSANLWGAGLNLAKLGAGFLGGKAA